MNAELQHRKEIVHFGKLLHRTGLVAATDGNLSILLENGNILCTPTFMSKGLMEAEDLVVVDQEGRKIEGWREASSEIAMHMLIYRTRRDARAVVHAHPPTATGFAAAGIPLECPLASDIVVTLGSVPLAEYKPPGTPELSETLAPFLCEHVAILMANHGVVTFGEDLPIAYTNMERVEQFAKITLTTYMLDRQRLLSAKHVEDSAEIRPK